MAIFLHKDNVETVFDLWRAVACCILPLPPFRLLLYLLQPFPMQSPPPLLLQLSQAKRTMRWTAAATCGIAAAAFGLERPSASAHCARAGINGKNAGKALASVGLRPPGLWREARVASAPQGVMASSTMGRGWAGTDFDRCSVPGAGVGGSGAECRKVLCTVSGKQPPCGDRNVKPVSGSVPALSNMSGSSGQKRRCLASPVGSACWGALARLACSNSPSCPSPEDSLGMPPADSLFFLEPASFGTE